MNDILFILVIRLGRLISEYRTTFAVTVIPFQIRLIIFVTICYMNLFLYQCKIQFRPHKLAILRAK